MNARLAFVVRRLVSTIPVLFVTSVVVFLIIRLVPGDPVQSMLGLHATPDNVAATRRQLGLDRPLFEQYWTWLGNLLHGDLGRDLSSHTPVATLISQRLPVTIELAFGAVFLGVLGGVGIGLATAAGSPGWRRWGEAFSIVGITVPYFWLGIVLALIFAGVLHVLPPSGYAALTDDPVANLQYMMLPTVTLAVGEAAYLSRVTRGVASGLLAGPSVTFLRAKGLSMFSILFKHVLRQGSAPIVTIVGIEVGVLLGGAIVVETIFGLPGLGKLVVVAIQQRNYTVVQGCVLVISAMFILATLITDLCVGLLDPRLSRAARK